DGDGDADVLSASAGDDKIAWYENLGDGSFGPQQVITAAADGAVTVYATDLDGDGDADVLSASNGDDSIAWYENSTPYVISVDDGSTTGNVSLAGGVISYDPNGQFENLDDGETAIDSFTYIVSDGGCSDQATVTITITGVNDCPEADDQAIIIDEDDDFAGQLTATDVEGLPNGGARSYDALSSASQHSAKDALERASYFARSGPFSAHAPATYGALGIDPDGSFSYSTAGAFNHLAVGESATDAFTFLVTDGECSDIGKVVLTIYGANDAPSTSDQTHEIATGQRAAITLTGSDPDSDPLRFAISSVTDGVIRNFSPSTGAVLFEPTANSASFGFSVFDPFGGVATGTVTVTQAGWALPIGVTNGAISEIQFGQHPSAALSVPATLGDAIHLRVGPAPFFAAFQPLADSATWELHVDATSNIFDVVFFWDSAQVPVGLIIEGVGDMRQTNTLVAPAGQVSVYAIHYGALIFDIDLISGWNLIALPITPDDSDPSQLGPQVFRWDDGYVPVTALEPGVGYFVHLANPRTVTIVGTAPADLSTPISPAWNVIGIRATSPFAPRSWLEALTPSAAVDGIIWYLEDRIYKAEDIWLRPGIGYWVYGQEVAR
ncbi:MAG: VCBS repeat-containing protein, partial [Rhodothermales bacterium]